MIKKIMLLAGLCLGLGCISTAMPGGEAGAKKNFTISPKSKAYKNKYRKSDVYNKRTKDYLLIKSYLVTLEKAGGGTLKLKKGTYNISNALAVPSNTKIILENGVVINKTAKTGVKRLPASHILFELVRDTRIKKKGVVKRYGGEKNISIISEGSATINLGGCNKSQAIRIPHCQNVTVENIHFKNLRNGHFIEIVGAKNTTVKGCLFEKNKSGDRCAINVDTPDKKTDGFNGAYSKFDKTPVDGLTVTGCTFKNLYRSIDTHKYSPNKYHQNISISDCKFINNKFSPIKMLNWRGCTIQNNIFNYVSGYSSANYKSEKFGIYILSGCGGLNIQNNSFDKVFIAIYAKDVHTQKYGKKSLKSKNRLSKQDKDSTKNNTIGAGVIIKDFNLQNLKNALLYI
ncbi:MAG: right-handed parallel beta-helix repeat-containing protein [Eubacterium sp.]|nr:right-handed parallel beta-helix repeat-containing protein [Eubacterium sp.]